MMTTTMMMLTIYVDSHVTTATTTETIGFNDTAKKKQREIVNTYKKAK